MVLVNYITVQSLGVSEIIFIFLCQTKFFQKYICFSLTFHGPRADGLKLVHKVVISVCLSDHNYDIS